MEHIHSLVAQAVFKVCGSHFILMLQLPACSMACNHSSISPDNRRPLLSVAPHIHSTPGRVQQPHMHNLVAIILVHIKPQQTMPLCMMLLLHSASELQGSSNSSCSSSRSSSRPTQPLRRSTTPACS